MQQPEESAPKPKTQSGRILRLERQRAVVQLELLERLLQVPELIRVGRKEPGEDHGLDLAVARQRLRGAVLGGRDGVADARVDHVLDRRGHIADLARRQLLCGARARREPAHLVDLVDLVGVHHPDSGPGDDLAVHDAHVGDDAAIGVVVRVEDQRAQRSGRIAVRRRYPRDHGFENRLRADALLGGGKDDLVPRDARDV